MIKLAIIRKLILGQLNENLKRRIQPPTDIRQSEMEGEHGLGNKGTYPKQPLEMLKYNRWEMRIHIFGHGKLRSRLFLASFIHIQLKLWSKRRNGCVVFQPGLAQALVEEEKAMRCLPSSSSRNSNQREESELLCIILIQPRL